MFSSSNPQFLIEATGNYRVSSQSRTVIVLETFEKFLPGYVFRCVCVCYLLYTRLYQSLSKDFITELYPCLSSRHLKIRGRGWGKYNQIVLYKILKESKYFTINFHYQRGNSHLVLYW